MLKTTPVLLGFGALAFLTAIWLSGESSSMLFTTEFSNNALTFALNKAHNHMLWLGGHGGMKSISSSGAHVWSRTDFSHHTWEEGFLPKGSFSMLNHLERDHSSVKPLMNFVQQLNERPSSEYHHILSAREVIDVLEEPHVNDPASWIRFSRDPSSPVQPAAYNKENTVDHWQYYVTLTGPVTPQKRASVQAAVPGIHLGWNSYMPQNTYVEWLTPAEAFELEEVDEVLWIGLVPPEHKLSPSLAVETPPDETWFLTQSSLRMQLAHASALGDALEADVLDAARATKGLESDPSEFVFSLTADPLIVRVEGVNPVDHWSVARQLVQVPAVSRVEVVALDELFMEWANIAYQGGKSDSHAVDFPVHLMGIRGAEQVVGIHDSGVDRSSCYFNDPEGDSIGADHRKIVGYHQETPISDAGDFVEGHGSHCAGSIAAFNEANPGETVGVAPAARLSVSDGSTDGYEGASASTDPFELLFDLFFQDGARIFSNSWGINNYGEYDLRTAAFDEWLFENQQSVNIHAAGNSGNFELPLTVGSPGGSKNTLTVGNGWNNHDSMLENWCPDPDPADTTTCVTFQAVNPDPPEPSRGKEWGPAAYSASTGDQVWDFDNLSWSSSRGPMQDGRLKPDVVGVGTFILSASGGKTCELNEKAGTSMATPGVAGGAALIREWMTEWHPYLFGRGTPPNGLALKAAIITSAVRMGGDIAPTESGFGTLNGDSFNGDTGFGRVVVTRVIPTEPNNENRGTYFWYRDAAGPYDEGTSIGNGEESSIEVPVGGTTLPFEVTMCFYDPAGTVSSPPGLTDLTNNLDLIVELNGEVVCKGNELSEHVADGPSTVDVCEKCIIEEPQEASYTIKVVGTNVPTGKVEFAVVTSGVSGPSPIIIYAAVGAAIVLVSIGLLFIVVRSRRSESGTTSSPIEKNQGPDPNFQGVGYVSNSYAEAEFDGGVGLEPDAMTQATSRTRAASAEPGRERGRTRSRSRNSGGGRRRAKTNVSRKRSAGSKNSRRGRKDRARTVI